MESYTDAVNFDRGQVIENQEIYGGIFIIHSGTIVRNNTFIQRYPGESVIKLDNGVIDCVIENNTVKYSV